ncbi:MAG: outer membrane protein transport protein, partial [Candidatus Eisenbacteria bacterium]
QAGAFTARADDPSAIFFNPAGLAQLETRELLVSPNLAISKTEFAGVAPNPGFDIAEHTRTKGRFPFAAYYAHGLGGRVAAGIGVYHPYGFDVEWAFPAWFSGRYISTHSRITPISFAPTAAVAIDDRLRVGAGANLVLSTVEFARYFAAYDPISDATRTVGRVDLKSENGFGAGFNLGAQWWPPGRLKFGATYRSRVRVEHAGLADFRQVSSGDPAFDAVVAASFPPDQRATTSIPFPAQGALGVSYQACPSWAFEADAQLTWWSAFDRFTIAFAQDPSMNIEAEEGWSNALGLRVGAEHRKGGTAAWSYRAGYSYDRTPQPRASLGPWLPDTDRHGLSLGFGHDGPQTSVNAYALWQIMPDRSTEGENREGYDGTYSPTSLLAGLSLGFHFP